MRTSWKKRIGSMSLTKLKQEIRKKAGPCLDRPLVDLIDALDHKSYRLGYDQGYEDGYEAGQWDYETSEKKLSSTSSKDPL